MCSFQVVGRWVAIIAVCACVLAGCAPMGGVSEGSSTPPAQSGSYVFPSPDLQVYD
jgi:hypothetical protein